MDRWKSQEETMKLFEKCPVCGGDLVAKDVEKVLKGGTNTAVVKVKAEVCLHCGERLYASKTISRFEDIRKKLSEEDVSDFEPIGKTYQVA
jgi:YgiT-type zinc finger domain-containing protein